MILLTTFDKEKRIIKIDDFIKNKSKTKTFQKVTINKSSSMSNKIKIKETTYSKDKQKSRTFSLFKTKNKEQLIYPLYEYKDLAQNCQILIQEAQDDAEKHFQVGKNLFEGLNNFPIKTEIGIKYFEQSIKNGCIDSVIYYSGQLIDAKIIPQDLDKAKKILKKHLRSNNPDILLLYGKIMKKEKKYSKAMKYFDIASKSGCVETMYEYGKLLYKGRGCSKNEKEARKYFQMALKNEFTKCEKYLPNNLKQTSVPNNATTQNDIRNTIIKKDSNSINDYALKLRDGNGVTVNKTDAAYYFKIAADKGNVDAMLNYANIINNGDGVTADKIGAAHYFKLAADNGNVDAMFIYGQMLEEGNGIPKDKAESVRFIKIAADKGNSKAMIEYAYMLYFGLGVTSDNAEAELYYKKAAHSGDIDGMNKYTDWLRRGFGPTLNKAEAARYFKMAADKGNIDAMKNYAEMLSFGDGIPVNKTEAVYYTKMAADKGDSYAMVNCAEMLKNGIGIPVNKTEAVNFLTDTKNQKNNADITKKRQNADGIIKRNFNSNPENKQFIIELLERKYKTFGENLSKAITNFRYRSKINEARENIKEIERISQVIGIKI